MEQSEEQARGPGSANGAHGEEPCRIAPETYFVEFVEQGFFLSFLFGLLFVFLSFFLTLQDAMHWIQRSTSGMDTSRDTVQYSRKQLAGQNIIDP